MHLLPRVYPITGRLESVINILNVISILRLAKSRGDAYAASHVAIVSQNNAVPEARPGLAIILRIFSVLCGASMSVLVKFTTSARREPRRDHVLSLLAVDAVHHHVGHDAWRIRHREDETAGRPAASRSDRMSSMLMTFITLSILPLAEATTLFFLSPLLATALSIVMLKEHVGFHRWAAIAFGIVGMLIMVQPGGHHGALPSIGIASGTGRGPVSGIEYHNAAPARQHGNGHGDVFWFTLIGTIVTSVALPFYAQWHEPKIWILMCCCGLAGTAGQILLTSALRYAPVSATAPVEYTQLLWATLFGWLIWSDLPA